MAGLFGQLDKIEQPKEIKKGGLFGQLAPATPIAPLEPVRQPTPVAPTPAPTPAPAPTKDFGIFGKELSPLEQMQISRISGLQPQLLEPIVEKTPEIGKFLETKLISGAKEAPFVSGFLETSLPQDQQQRLERILGRRIDIPESRARAVGKITGQVAQFVGAQAIGGGIVKGLISKVPAIAKLSTGGKIAQTSAKLLTETAKDITIGTPISLGINTRRANELGLENTDKRAFLIQEGIKDVLIDIGANALFAGAGAGIRALKGTRRLTDASETIGRQLDVPSTDVENAILNANSADEAINIIDNIIPGRIARPIVPEAGPLLRDIPVGPLKPTVEPTPVLRPTIEPIIPKAPEVPIGPLRPAIEPTISRVPTVEPIVARPTAEPIIPKILEVPVKPTDTIAKVLTETPKGFKANIADRAERAYQEIFATNIPFEKIGGPARVQGSNLNRVQGTIEYNAVGKQVDMQGNEVGKSIVDIFSDVPKESKRNLFDYTLNTHNIDRFREGKPIFGETVNSEMSLGKVAEYDRINPEFKGKQQEITNYFNNLMDDWAVKSGLVSEESAKMLKERYPNYVPTYRAVDLPKSMTQGNQNIAQVIRKAKGSEKFILPIDQQMIAMTDRTIKNARKNELMNTIANAFEAGDSSVNRYIKEIKGLPKESIDDLIDVGKNFDEIPVLKGDEYAVNFYTNGKPRQMLVNKTLFKALENTSSDDAINKVANAVKKYATQPFKEVVTGKNPLFGASNIMRDVPTALTYSSNPIKMSANVPRAVKEMTTNGPLFRQFKAMGGTREGLIGAGKEFKVPSLGETNKAFKSAQKFNPIKVVGDVNNFTETLPRFSEFLTVLDDTGNPATALYRSAELTTDFSRHGKLTKLIDSFVPYLNPSVQGIDKFFREIKANPLKTLAKGATAITLPTIILDQMNKDDDDYNNLNARERNLFFNVPYTDDKGNKKFVRVPKSRELGVAFSSLYEWAARKSRGQEVTGEEMAQAIVENFSPTDIFAPIWTSAQKAWKQIKNPEAYETNYWGGLIVPQSQRRFSPGEQYDLNSSGIAKAIGQKFNISPFVTDYFLKSYGGIISQVVQPIGAAKKVTPLAPLQKKFITDPVFKAASVGKFYDVLNVSKKEAQDFNRKHNVPSKIVTPLERKANALNKLSLQMSKIRAEQKRLQIKKGNEDRIRELQIQINKIAERGLK